jgi:hypothetical protein
MWRNLAAARLTDCPGAVGKGVDNRRAAADLVHDPRERTVGADARPTLAEQAIGRVSDKADFNQLSRLINGGDF